MNTFKEASPPSTIKWYKTTSNNIFMQETWACRIALPFLEVHIQTVNYWVLLSEHRLS